ncbi:unnamed protein product [Closterium sp. NIES-54]
MVAAEMVAAGMVSAEVVAADMVDAEMVAAEMVAAEMVSAGLPCDHSSFAAALPSLPFWLVVPHPSGSVTHPRPLAPLHAGRLPVRHGSAAHGPLRPQRGSSPLQHTRPGISSRVCQTSASSAVCELLEESRGVRAKLHHILLQMPAAKVVGELGWEHFFNRRY